MANGFDRFIDRHHTNSIKWDYTNEDELPMFIADMDFEEIDTKISHKLGRKVSGYIKDDALLGRGQVYLAENRFISAAEVERGLATHDRRKSAFVGRCI